jgi:hypothetical protein
MNKRDPSIKKSSTVGEKLVLKVFVSKKKKCKNSFLENSNVLFESGSTILF